MIHRAVILAAFGMLATSTLAHAQQGPLPVSEIAPGPFVHVGVTELMTRENEGAIANIGFIIGGDVVAVVDTEAASTKGDSCLQPFTPARKSQSDTL
jgi:hypothetical protein